jgi:short-chain Z-isoprenyl diphosphate synthase
MTATAAPPLHIGIIPDGNRRWARQAGVSVSDAHRRGAVKTVEVLHWCEQAGVRAVTIWALSAANFARHREVPGMLRAISELVEHLAAVDRWGLRIVGSPELLGGHPLCTELARVQRRPSEGGLQVDLAVAYDGREDIVSAAHRLLAADGAELTVEAITDLLAAEGRTDCDLVIRTSGEYRLSGFLLWQAAQSELHFCSSLWPDFSQDDFQQALLSYARRDRRFGR